MRHPTFGPILKAWSEERAVPARAKRLACLLLVFSWVMLWAGGLPIAALAGFGGFFALVAAFLCSRPSPSIANVKP